MVPATFLTLLGRVLDAFGTTSARTLYRSSPQGCDPSRLRKCHARICFIHGCGIKPEKFLLLLLHLPPRGGVKHEAASATRL